VASNSYINIYYINVSYTIALLLRPARFASFRSQPTSTARIPPTPWNVTIYLHFSFRPWCDNAVPMSRHREFIFFFKTTIIQDSLMTGCASSDTHRGRKAKDSYRYQVVLLISMSIIGLSARGQADDDAVIRSDKMIVYSLLRRLRRLEGEGKPESVTSSM
jgi:hypothetical protein